jgi:hypothetical protein
MSSVTSCLGGGRFPALHSCIRLPYRYIHSPRIQRHSLPLHGLAQSAPSLCLMLSLPRAVHSSSSSSPACITNSHPKTCNENYRTQHTYQNLICTLPRCTKLCMLHVCGLSTSKPDSCHPKFEMCHQHVTNASLPTCTAAPAATPHQKPWMPMPPLNASHAASGTPTTQYLRKLYKGNRFEWLATATGGNQLRLLFDDMWTYGCRCWLVVCFLLMICGHKLYLHISLEGSTPPPSTCTRSAHMYGAARREDTQALH